MPYLYGNLPNIEFKTYSGELILEKQKLLIIRVQDGNVEPYILIGI